MTTQFDKATKEELRADRVELYRAVAGLPVIDDEPRTLAEKFADQFDNNGQRWTTDDGIKMDVVAEGMSAITEQQEGVTSGNYRYIFPDQSVITVHGDGWDFGYIECWCWAGCPCDGCEKCTLLMSSSA